MNKTIKISIGIVGVIIIAIIAIIFIIKPVNQEVNNEGLYEYKPFNLPAINQVDLQEDPNLYDFLYGSLGWHTDIISLESDMCYAILVKDYSSVFYISSYMPVSGDIVSFKLMPLAFGSAPYKFSLDSEENKDRFYTLLETIEEKYNCGEYDLYILRSKNESPNGIGFNENKFGPLSFAQVDVSNLSLAQQSIKQGLGYDTSLLREKFSDNLLQFNKIDIFDPFWDNINFGSRIKVERIDETKATKALIGDYCILSPAIIQIVYGEGATEPFYGFALNNFAANVDTESLNEYLVNMGFESIDQALANKKYASQEELEEIIKLQTAS
ncbi:MAG: hypothetical protein LBC35_03870 [Coriobacteriales bacterium]|jgi:hypothetical protein|nr:hypothetical protein [Coriobacteriales bacterium]